MTSAQLWQKHAVLFIERLQGIDPPEFRLRLGDYRLFFRLNGQILRILAVKNRKDAYRLFGE